LKLKFYLFRQKFYRLFWSKKDFEMEAQKKRAKEMANPEIRERVRQYYYKFRFLQEVIDSTGINDNCKILDIGCGIKTVLHFLPGKLKAGIDPLAEDYKRIYNYPSDLKIQKFFGENIGYPDDFFDVVFVTNALDHTENPERVIQEARRVLKKQGYLVLVNEIVEKNFKRNRAHPHNLEEKDILGLLSNQFKIIFKKYSPWIGIRQYYLGQIKPESRDSDDNQLTILAQKV